MIAQYPDSRNGRTKEMNGLNPTHVRRAPNKPQGAWIGYQLKARGLGMGTVATRAGVTSQFVCQVALGLRTSARVQKAIAEILGFANWDSLLASRPEVAA